MDSRLSWSFLPRASAISTFTLPSLKYTRVGTRVNPFSFTFTLSLWIFRLCRSNLRRRSGSTLNRLPAKYRDVVALFYMQEKSYDEVALMLDLPIGTVKTYLFRARKSLAEELARERVRKGGG